VAGRAAGAGKRRVKVSLQEETKAWQVG